jgi:uncharacterized protein (TIGR03663 family)
MENRLFKEHPRDSRLQPVNTSCLNRNKFRILIICFIILTGTILRFYSLSVRPMHTDEAVNAFMLARLLEEGKYIYDRNEHHGPALYYLSLVPAFIRSQHDRTTLEKTTLRMTTAISGIALVLVIFILARFTGWPLVLTASLLFAISPALVYYSRYFIHEIMLVVFNGAFLISFFRYTRSRKPGWIIIAGLFGGLMVATKETWVILIASQSIALAVVNFPILRSPETLKRKALEINYYHYLLFFLSAAIVVIVLFSSFFTNMAGIADLSRAYPGYFHRAGSDSAHIHPWYYYFKLIIIDRCVPFYFRADTWLVAGGIAGMALVLIRDTRTDKNRPVYLFIAVYTLVSAVIYSAIPYKTPWNVLAFYTPLVFLSAFFFLYVAGKTGPGIKMFLYLAGLGLIFGHLLRQNYSDNFLFHDHPCNPYVYAHPDKDILLILNEVEKIASSSPEGNEIFMEVIYPDSEYWPLPWYFRNFPNVGWWNEVNMKTPPAPLIISAPEYNFHLTKKLYEIPKPGERHMYINVTENEHMLRPGAPVIIYLRKEYWDMYMAAKQL